MVCLVLSAYVVAVSLGQLACSPGQVKQLDAAREKIDEQLKCVKEVR